MIGENKKQWRMVYHTSRALTKAEQNYGKIEGESLAVFSGTKTNSRYLYSRAVADAVLDAVTQE